MVTTTFYNMDTKQFGNSIDWKDDNSAKAFMFDLLMNYEYEFSYISIEKFIEGDFVIYYKHNHSKAHSGITCVYD